MSCVRVEVLVVPRGGVALGRRGLSCVCFCFVSFSVLFFCFVFCVFFFEVASLDFSVQTRLAVLPVLNYGAC